MSNVINLDSILVKDYDFAKEKLGQFDVIKNLSIGDVIRKGHGLSYTLDSSSFVNTLQVKGSKLDFEKVYKAFSGGMLEVKNLFKDKRTVPFSEAINKCIGECLEKSIMTYLLLDNVVGIEENMIVNGSLSAVGSGKVGQHSFNVTKVKDSWYLIDSHNPLQVEPFVPFYNVVQGIKINPGLPFVFDESVNTNRNYYLK
ncbi:MAG: hypothetical protein ACLFN8_01555 [Candidatus Woesearchaeota archaeon]